jgi:hypothetical protein
MRLVLKFEKRTKGKINTKKGAHISINLKDTINGALAFFSFAPSRNLADFFVRDDFPFYHSSTSTDVAPGNRPADFRWSNRGSTTGADIFLFPDSTQRRSIHNGLQGCSEHFLHGGWLGFCRVLDFFAALRAAIASGEISLFPSSSLKPLSKVSRRSLKMQRRQFLIGTSQSVIGAALLPIFPRPQKSSGTTDAARLIGDLEKEIPQTMEETRVPGLSIAVVRDGKLFWRRGFGVRHSGSGARVDNDTVFNVGSVSKTVFAYAVMKLSERGRHRSGYATDPLHIDENP